MYRFLRPFLFRFSPETAHKLGVQVAAWRGQLPFNALELANLRQELWGLDFPNVVGIAAGLDKNVQGARGFAAFGAGHVEVGTLTRLPQAGNPQPRVFRLVAERAIINRMGFPNIGIQAALPRLQAIAGTGKFVLGINLGKGKDTPLEEASADYVALLQAVYRLAGYITINISSPNTVGLRALQGRQFLQEFLRPILQARDALRPQLPILVKIAPDLSWEELDDVLLALSESHIQGVIATNTTLARPAHLTSAERSQTGGLSGAPLREHSTAVIRYIYQRTQGQLPIVGVGGVDSSESALEKISAGASLVQVYSALIYHGPALLRTINLGLAKRLKEIGASNVREIVGQKL